MPSPQAILNMVSDLTDEQLDLLIELIKVEQQARVVAHLRTAIQAEYAKA